jgi:transcriptional regulator with XRE-family HTH domain
MESLGEKILAAIREKRVNQAELGRKLNVSRQAVQNLKNKSSIPVKVLLILRDEYDIDFVEEAVEKNIATIDNADELELLSGVREKKNKEDYTSVDSHKSKGKTTISLTLEIDEDDGVFIPGDLSKLVMEFIKQNRKHLEEQQ